MSARFTKREWFQRGGLFLAALLFFFLMLRLLDPFADYSKMTAALDLRLQVLLTLVFVIPACWLIFFTKAGWVEILFGLLISACALYLRTGFFENKTMDHQYHLDIWLQHFQENGGFSALRNPVGNYNLPYLYFVAAASYFSSSFIVLKFLALPFEFLAAIFAFKITALKAVSFYKSFLCYAIMLCLPTLILNNSYWGQCDIIFASFVIVSLYYLLTKRNFLALLFWGLAFSFKMQAFFIFPLYFVLWLHGDLHIKDFPGALVSYLLIHIPGLFFGYPLARVFSVYTGQMAEVETSRDFLVLNAPNVYHFFAKNLETGYDTFSTWGIGLVVIVMLLLGLLGWTRRDQKWDGKQVLLLAVFISVFVPYFLPGMEDRVFFVADLISFLVVFYCQKMLWPALLTNFASWMAYSFFLFGEYQVDYRLLAACNGVALILCGIICYRVFAVRAERLEEPA